VLVVSFDPHRQGGCSVVFKQLVIRAFLPILISEADHLFIKQLLCQLSYAGIPSEGYRKPF
jgi:hypothetical protein